MTIARNVTELIGRTPLVRLNRISGRDRRRGPRQARVGEPRRQRQGPHRPGDDRGRRGGGLIAPGRTTIVEPTSGNTGIALAMVAAARGYDIILTMPETMSVERRNLLKAYGARLVLTPGAEGMKRRDRARPEVAGELLDAFVPQQFENPANPEVHRRTTAAGDLGRHRRGRRHRSSPASAPAARSPASAASSRRRSPACASSPSSRPTRRCSPAASPARTRSRASAPGFVPPVLDTGVYDEIVRRAPTRRSRRRGPWPATRASSSASRPAPTCGPRPRSRSEPRAAARRSSPCSATPASGISRRRCSPSRREAGS